MLCFVHTHHLSTAAWVVSRKPDPHAADTAPLMLRRLKGASSRFELIRELSSGIHGSLMLASDLNKGEQVGWLARQQYDVHRLLLTQLA
jgi:hypothetical protein